MHEITNRLEPSEDSASDSDATPTAETFVTHLHPGEKPNILTCMKSLITGFVDRSPDESTGVCVLSHGWSDIDLGVVVQPKRKPSASLAVYDIELLKAWYDVACTAYGTCPFECDHPKPFCSRRTTRGTPAARSPPS